MTSESANGGSRRCRRSEERSSATGVTAETSSITPLLSGATISQLRLHHAARAAMGHTMAGLFELVCVGLPVDSISAIALEIAPQLPTDVRNACVTQVVNSTLNLARQMREGGVLPSRFAVDEPIHTPTVEDHTGYDRDDVPPSIHSHDRLTEDLHGTVPEFLVARGPAAVAALFQTTSREEHNTELDLELFAKDDDEMEPPSGRGQGSPGTSRSASRGPHGRAQGPPSTSRSVSREPHRGRGQGPPGTSSSTRDEPHHGRGQEAPGASRDERVQSLRRLQEMMAYIKGRIEHYDAEK